MFLKNYTSEVPVSQTIYRIEQVLIQCGVTAIAKDYGLGAKVVAITFKVDGPDGHPMAIRLPANEAAAQEALWKDYIGDDLLPDGKLKWPSRKRRTKESFKDQGERTAWRIVKDWVEVQMSMIQCGQADILQVFLPYVFDGKVTYYQALKEAKFAGLLQAQNPS
jgi:hypothetical protein